MTTVVPFDNTDLSRAALGRATEIAEFAADLHAVTVIPNNNREYARERGWIGADAEFDPETVVGELSDNVDGIAPDATYDYIVVSRYANAGEIGNKLRRYAKDAGAETVVIGSDNAGRVVSTLGSIGRAVATDTAYDVFIVRSLTSSGGKGDD